MSSTVESIVAVRPALAVAVAPPLSISRVPQLDGIRGIAILLVLIWHYAGVKLPTAGGSFPDLLARSISLTWTGVDLFFVLSGFLIGGILLDNQRAPHYFSAFYLRRITRIFPLYFAWLGLYAVVTLVIPTWSASEPLRGLFGDGLPFWSCATFTQNFFMVTNNTYGPEWLGITWSLAIEEQFYALIPLLIRFIPQRRLPFLLFVYIVGAPLLRVVLVLTPGYTSLVNQVLLPSRADTLLLGVLCAYAVRQPRVLDCLRAHLAELYATCMILLVGYGVLAFQFNTPRSFVLVSLGYSWLAFTYACFLLLAVVDDRGPLAAVTRNTALRGLGLLAYGVYLIHQAVNILLHRLLLGQWPQLETIPDVLVTCLSVVATLFIAKLSYRIFEKPMLEWGHRVKYWDTEK